MEVSQVHDLWLEDGERERCWCDADEALNRLEFEPLRELVRRAVERLKEE